MEITAVTKNGLGTTKEIKIVEISNTKNLNLGINVKNITALLMDAKENKKMQVYTRGPLMGRIDAFGDTPLYTNGQESVTMLLVNGTMVWKK